MTIKLLNNKVISQIAAGEVVERPASVVKELLENALDAGSTQITVEIKNGGISLVRVTDNGTGIPDDEAELAFGRHATSKIGDIQDLQQLTSLGFRGEALPSIAAVARVEMSTGIRGAAAGTYINLEDGQIVSHDPQAHSAGTTITVHNLFQRIPARLKFLKSASAEAGRVADIVSRYALAYPEVKFTLINEGKTSLRTPGSGKLIDGIMAVYGLEVARNMLEVKSQEIHFDSGKSLITVAGMVGSPQLSRSNRDSLSFFINRRWVNSRMLVFAVEEAFHDLLMHGRHPVAVVNITLPPNQVDVNVHPAKTEVKFQDERAIFIAVQRSVREALVRTSPVHRVEEIKPQFGAPSTPFIATPPSAVGKAPERETRPEADLPPPTPLISLPLLRVLGQFTRNYIIAEGPDGLFLIDQHAAHERIQFEKIKKQRDNRKVEVQGLLQPVTFEVEPKQAAVMNRHLVEMTDLGFSIEAFGERTFLVRAVPAVIKDRDWKDLLKESLDSSARDWMEGLLSTLACHSAIRAGQVLSDSEMRELVRQLEETDLPNSCPHGRPTMIQISRQQIEKEFGRT